MTIQKATNIKWHDGHLTREERWRLLKCRGATMWLTGLPSSGKSTLSSAIELALVQKGRSAYRLDGDNVRHGLNKNLGFSAEDRTENIRRIGEVARLFADAGSLALTAFISPYRRDRRLARELHEVDGIDFIEIFVDAPLEVCEARDPKGLYRRARQGLIQGVTGIDDPYEPPEAPELVLKTSEYTVEACVEQCIDLLVEKKLILARPQLLNGGQS